MIHWYMSPVSIYTANSERCRIPGIQRVPPYYIQLSVIQGIKCVRTYPEGSPVTPNRAFSTRWRCWLQHCNTGEVPLQLMGIRIRKEHQHLVLISKFTIFCVSRNKCHYYGIVTHIHSLTKLLWFWPIIHYYIRALHFKINITRSGNNL